MGAEAADSYEDSEQDSPRRETAAELAKQLRELGTTAVKFAGQLGNGTTSQGTALPLNEEPGSHRHEYWEEPVVEQLIAALMGLIRAARSIVPEELDDQLKETLKELLGTLRLLIDRLLSQLEKQEPERFDVEDIPIT